MFIFVFFASRGWIRTNEEDDSETRGVRLQVIFFKSFFFFFS